MCLLPRGVCKRETCQKQPGQPFETSQKRDEHMDFSFDERYKCSICDFKSHDEELVSDHISGVKYCALQGSEVVNIETEEHWRKSLGMLVLPTYKDDPLYEAVKKATSPTPA